MKSLLGEAIQRNFHRPHIYMYIYIYVCVCVCLCVQGGIISNDKLFITAHARCFCFSANVSATSIHLFCDKDNYNKIHLYSTSDKQGHSINVNFEVIAWVAFAAFIMLFYWNSVLMELARPSLSLLIIHWAANSTSIWWHAHYVPKPN